jgi:cell division protein FtsI (penicillin-binding protein 3)
MRDTRIISLGDPHKRLRIGLALLLVLALAVVGRMVQIQTVDGQAWAAQAEDQRLRTVTLAASRGAILDRSGAPLAQSVQARAIFADPKFVTDPAANAAALANLLGSSGAQLEAKMSRTTNDSGKAIRFVYLGRGLAPEVGDAVEKLKLPGIYQMSEERRDVPGHDLAANVIGFTGQDGEGLAGIEARYDSLLAGKDGSRSYEVSKTGQAIPDGVDREVAAKPGGNVELTLDRDLQFEAQRILAARVQSTKGATGSAVVLDAKSGEVLAMASYPSYDAASPGTSSPSSRMDLATASVVEPGSVHKVITLGAALQEGVITPQTVLTVPPSIRKGGTTFHDTHEHGTVRMTLMGVLAQSSNIGTIMVSDSLGAQKLYDYQREFGLGEKTEVGLPGESAGIVQPPANWSGPSYGGVPIGMGVATTPLQMASVYQTIANGGVRVPPRLLKGTVNADGTLVPAEAPKQTRVISAENAAALRVMLESVPTSQGTAPAAAIPGYRVAGKTGTGQRVQDGKYLPGNVASFIGMVPADAPKFVIAVFVHAPAGVGGAVAGPCFHDLASFALRQFDVPPTGTAPPAIRIYG